MAGRGDEASLRADVPAVVRHGRACPGHPRALVPPARTWMAGTRPGMTALRAVRHLRSEASASFERLERRSANVVMAGRGDEASLRAGVPAVFVMAGLVPAIHVLCAASKYVDARHKAAQGRA